MRRRAVVRRLDDELERSNGFRSRSSRDLRRNAEYVISQGVSGGMAELMQGKRGLIMGVANDHSIAWGIAKTIAAHGAQLAFTYQGEALGKRVKPLAASIGAKLVMACDVENIASVDATFEAVKKEWGGLDFLVHAIAFSDKNELKGRYADTTRENFSRTMLISCFA